MRLFTSAVAVLLLTAPAFAQGEVSKSGSQGAAGNGGNGTTTSSSSGPEAKAGAERSPTGGAPTHDSAATPAVGAGGGGSTKQ